MLSDRIGAASLTPASSPPTNASTSAAFIAEPASVTRLCGLLKRWCGITFDPSKSYLIQNRLRGVAGELNQGNLRGILDIAESPRGGPTRDRIVDVLTTHETLFYRDRSPFVAISEHLLPAIAAASKASPGGKRPRLHVWSAACSSGQEPYSLAMTLLETIPRISGGKLGDWDVRILATDVSPGIVAGARRGVYKDHEVRRGLDAALRKKYFRRDGDGWVINESVRRLVEFQVSNLDSGSLPAGPFDLVFCRNVLIYFDPADAQRIIRCVASKLQPDGRLLLGCSEVLRGVDDVLKMTPLGGVTAYQPAAPAFTSMT